MNTAISTPGYLLLHVSLALLFTVLSGLGDAYGFVHSAKAWQANAVVWPDAVKAIVGFLVSILTYLLSIRHLGLLGVLTPEVQVLVWLTVTLVGLAIFSGRILQWSTPDQFVGMVVILGIAWLICRVE